MRENWLDKTISFFSPQAGARRLRAKILQGQISDLVRKYDGAKVGRRTDGWYAGSTSANTEIRGALQLLRNRSRELIRNEGYAQRAAQTIASNVVGAGILGHATSKSKGRSRIFDRLWNQWAETTDCDYDGAHNFYGLQSLAMRTVFESGEVLIRRRRRPFSSDSSIPVQIQVLEPDFLDVFRDWEKLDNGNYILQGVEFDRDGHRVAYWLYDQHPGDLLLRFRGSLLSKRVPAEEVKHVFRMDRSGQVRGVPWMAPVMIRMRDYSDYSDATLLRQKLSACFTAFVTDTENYDGMAANQTPPLGEKLEPGVIEILKPGQNIQFAAPPTSGDFAQFSREQLRAIAAGIGVTYEALTGDYSQVNFSSGRMGWIEFQRNIDVWRWHLLIPGMCIPVWKWFVEAAGLLGYGFDSVNSVWTPPRREMIDPGKEVAATKEAIRTGITSLSSAIRENGYDPDVVFSEIAADNKKLDELGIVLDSDPRHDSSTAPAQTSDVKDPEKEEEP